MKNNVFIALFIIVIGNILFFSGCNSFVKKKNKEIIKIGAILPLTGKTSFIGKSILNGLKLAEEQNSNKIKILSEDCQGDPKIALTSYKKLLLTDNITYFIPALSSVTNALIPEIEKNNTFLFSTCVSSSKITLKSKKLFRLFLNSDGDARVMADFAFDKKNIKSFIIIYVNDDFGIDYYKTFADELNLKGGKIIFQESFTRGETDYKKVIMKIKSIENSAEGIYLLGYDNNFGIFLKQYAEYKCKLPIFSIATIAQPVVTESIKDKLTSLPQIYYTNTLLYAKDTINNRIREKFIKEYTNKFGEKPNYFAAFAYDWINVLSNCNTDSIIDNILKKEFKGVMGSIKFDNNRDAKFPVVIERLN